MATKKKTKKRRKLSKLHRERLLKLAKHLENGRPGGHEVFDFSIWSVGPVGYGRQCGTSGCALGECPTLFPDQWFLTPRGPNAWDVMCGNKRNLDGAEYFFGLRFPEASALFTSNSDGTPRRIRHTGRSSQEHP
jgi:hypothetical protein